MDITEIFNEFFVYGKNTREIETQTENEYLETIQMSEKKIANPLDVKKEEIIKENIDENKDENKDEKIEGAVSNFYLNSNLKDNISNFIKNKNNKPIIFLVNDEIVKQEMKKQLLENGIFDCVCINSVKNIILKESICNVIIDLNVVNNEFEEFVDTIEKILIINESDNYTVIWSVFGQYDNVSKYLLEDVFNSFKECNIIYDKNNCPKKLIKKIKALNKN